MMKRSSVTRPSYWPVVAQRNGTLFATKSMCLRPASLELKQGLGCVQRTLCYGALISRISMSSFL